MAKSEETAANYVLKPSACTPSFPRPAGLHIRACAGLFVLHPLVLESAVACNEYG